MSWKILTVESRAHNITLDSGTGVLAWRIPTIPDRSRKS